MKLQTRIIERENNKVAVIEVTGDYLPEGSGMTAKNRFEYNDTASVDIFKLNRTTGESLTSKTITLRTSSDEALVTLPSDGWFTSIHMVIPTSKWVNFEKDKKGSIINVYDIVYYIDGSDLFSLSNGIIKKVDVDELIDNSMENTTISRVDTEYFSIENIASDYVDKMVSFIQDKMYNGGCSGNSCKALRLLSGINLIKFYVRWDQLAEAERIIEKINYFSSNENTETLWENTDPKSCGCSLQTVRL